MAEDFRSVVVERILTCVTVMSVLLGEMTRAGRAVLAVLIEGMLLVVTLLSMVSWPVDLLDTDMAEYSMSVRAATWCGICEAQVRVDVRERWRLW